MFPPLILPECRATSSTRLYMVGRSSGCRNSTSSYLLIITAAWRLPLSSASPQFTSWLLRAPRWRTTFALCITLFQELPRWDPSSQRPWRKRWWVAMCRKCGGWARPRAASPFSLGTRRMTQDASPRFSLTPRCESWTTKRTTFQKVIQGSSWSRVRQSLQAIGRIPPTRPSHSPSAAHGSRRVMWACDGTTSFTSLIARRWLSNLKIQWRHWYWPLNLQELIKYKGLQVAPAELEALLLTHPSIMDAAVVGVPVAGEDGNEVPRAYIVADQAKVSASEVKDFIKAELASYKQLRGGVVHLEAIPKSPTGKILRRELRELVKKESRAARL